MNSIHVAQQTLTLCDRLAVITDVLGETTRLFLSAATAQVHTILRAEMESLGMQVRMDSVGNLIGHLPGTDPAAGTLLLGSHVDTVNNAGRYDGILGTSLSLQVIACFAEQSQRLPYDIELVHFSEEEGIRFHTPFLGSRALVGELLPDDWLKLDAEGTSVAEAVQEFLHKPSRVNGLNPATSAFVEVHIEQGPVLDSLDHSLGLVEVIVGQTRLALTFTGTANHAGTTPMVLRHDALAAAAQWIVAVEALAQATTGLVATVGVIQVTPDAVNIIPGEVTVSLDLRHRDDITRQQAVATLIDAAQAAAARRGVMLSHRETSQQASVPMHPELSRRLAEAAAAAGHSLHRMDSGAGHDAMILAPHVPTAMLFVRSPGGLSHHPDEAVLLEDVAAAAETLAALLQSLSQTRL